MGRIRGLSDRPFNIGWMIVSSYLAKSIQHFGILYYFRHLIVKVLESGGLMWKDVTSVYLSLADARSAFEQGSVDAWVV